MFCHKCGNKVNEGADFCHKCGAKMVADQSPQQAAEAQQSTVGAVLTATPPASPKTVKAASVKKKKWLFVLIPACIAIIAVVLVFALREDPYRFTSDIIWTNHQATAMSPINDFFNYSEEVLIRLMDNWGMELIDSYRHHYNRYDFGEMVFEYYTTGQLEGRMRAITITDPSLLSINGVSFDTNRAGFISMLGNPTEEFNDGFGYSMIYGTYLQIYLTSINGAVYEIQIWNPRARPY